MPNKLCQNTQLDMGIKRAGESLCSLMQILKFMSDRHLKICDPGPSKGRDHADPDPAKHLDKFMQEHEQVHGHKTIQVSMTPQSFWSL